MVDRRRFLQQLSGSMGMLGLAGLALLERDRCFAHESQGDAALRPTAEALRAVVEPGIAALGQKQNPDGSLAPRLGGPGITALAVAALLRHGRTTSDPVVAKGLSYLEQSIRPDGGIYDRGLANYTTCLAVLAFQEANQKGQYDRAIAAAVKFLKGLQTAHTDENDPAYGGLGYDGKTRPDLSNTQFFIEALTAVGTPANDPAIQKALVFVSRAQNLPGELNPLAFAKATTDEDRGGFVYNPLDQNNPKSEKRTAAGGLRSEGGMTYAGLKSFLYARVDGQDPRVVAAKRWISRHYSLEENPGMGTAGLYYYYHTLAKALSVAKLETVETSGGKARPWRLELFEALKKRQKPDGTWANDNRAFLENQPELATVFALLALSYCR